MDFRIAAQSSEQQRLKSIENANNPILILCLALGFCKRPLQAVCKAPCNSRFGQCEPQPLLPVYDL